MLETRSILLHRFFVASMQFDREEAKTVPMNDKRAKQQNVSQLDRIHYIDPKHRQTKSKFRRALHQNCRQFYRNLQDWPPLFYTVILTPVKKECRYFARIEWKEKFVHGWILHLQGQQFFSFFLQCSTCQIKLFQGTIDSNLMVPLKKRQKSFLIV